MASQNLLDDGALNPAAAAVDQADFAHSRGVRGVNVFADNRRDVAGQERVEVEAVFEGRAERIVCVQGV